MLRPLTARPGKIGLLVVVTLFEDVDAREDNVEVTEFDDVAAATDAVADVVMPLVAVGEELFERVPVAVPLAAAALANDSAMELSAGHKFVVCTSPLSKWKQSKTAAPTELRRATIELTMVHLFKRIS